MHIFVAILLPKGKITLEDLMDKHLDILKNDLKKVNVRKKIKIRMRKKNTNRYSLYLDLWKDNKRTYEYLNRYVEGSRESILSDDEAIRYAISYRDRKESELYHNGKSLKSINKHNLKANFVEYFKSLAENKSGTTQKKWLSVHKHLLEFTNGKVTIESIDAKFCQSFYNHLNKRGNHSTPKVYYKVFSAALNQLVWDEIIASNPARKAANNPDMKHKLQQNKEKPREFLSIEEVKRLISNPIDNKQIMNAFLFSCFTGLRLEDIVELTFSAINERYLYFRQLKTREDDRIKLHPVAYEIIKDQKNLQKKKSKKVFSLFENKATNRHLAKWVKKAGIEKKITFHCARHSFATIGLTYDISIYEIMKLLGHKDISSTEIYAKLIDKKKDEAIDKIPVL